MNGKLATIRKRKTMEVLWGAWAKRVDLDENEINVIGIYDVIYKQKRSDFPFTVDLLGVIVYQSSIAEVDKIYSRELTIMGLDAPMFSEEDQLTVPIVGDPPYRWYEEFELHNVEIREPGNYQLSVLINGEEKQIIPLWIVAPKMISHNREDDSTTEEWSEQ